MPRIWHNGDNKTIKDFPSGVRPSEKRLTVRRSVRFVLSPGRVRVLLKRPGTLGKAGRNQKVIGEQPTVRLVNME
jgi:hypothetical protein